MATPKQKSDIQDDSNPNVIHSPRIEALEAEIKALTAKANEVCKTCNGWKPKPSDPTLGDCMPSAKAMPYPIITMDRWSCSKWAAIK